MKMVWDLLRMGTIKQGLRTTKIKNALDLRFEMHKSRCSSFFFYHGEEQYVLLTPFNCSKPDGKLIDLFLS